MRLLHIDEQRPRPGIAAVGDRRIGRRHALYRNRLDPVLVGVEASEGEAAEAGRLLVELRDEQMVVLGLPDIEGRPDSPGEALLMLVGVAVLQLLHPGVGVAT